MSTPFYMLSLPLDERRLHAFSASQRLDETGETDDGYLLHAALAALFGKKDAPKPFAAQSGKGRQQRSLLAYSPRTADELKEIATLHAGPEIYQIIDWSTAADKPMPLAFRQDQQLDFTVRVLPVSRAGRQHPCFRPGAEIDVFYLKAKADFMHLKAEADHDGPKPVREDIYLYWLKDRLARGGADLVASEVTGRRRTNLVRKTITKTRNVLRQHPDIDVTGTLIVRDPALFRASVARGIGRHRAFGFGMLLLKPSTGRD